MLILTLAQFLSEERVAAPFVIEVYAVTQEAEPRPRRRYAHHGLRQHRKPLFRRKKWCSEDLILKLKLQSQVARTTGSLQATASNS